MLNKAISSLNHNDFPKEKMYLIECHPLISFFKKGS